MKRSSSTLIVAAITSGLLLTAVATMAQSTIFNDSFSSGSTLNSALSTPTASSTSYEVVSTKAMSIATINAGHLDLGFGSSSGNGYEIQALFANSPVTLTTVGDYIQLAVTFTDNGNFLTPTNGTLSAGMYNSGGIGPIAGGVNNASSANTTAATGGAQNWLGYVGQVSSNHSYINIRAAQTGTGNNNQDVTSAGGAQTTTKAYFNPFSTLGTNNTHTSLTLNSQYTMVLSYQLNGTGVLGITNSLYNSSGGVMGSLISEYDLTASGANYLTSSFDGLGFGIYANSTQGTTLDINQINVTDLIQPTPEPSTIALVGMGLLFLTRRFRRR